MALVLGTGLTVSGRIRAGDAFKVTEAGRTITQSQAPSANYDHTGFYVRGSDALFSCDVQLLSNGNYTDTTYGNGAMIWECGGSGTGTWVGVRVDGGTSYFRIRAGEGLTSVNLITDDTDIAVAEVDIDDYPEYFDGEIHNVSWDFERSTGTARVFIDGNQIISQAASGGSFESNIWAGSGSACYALGHPSSAPPGGTDFQPMNAWPGTVVSDLRYYQGVLANV